MLHTITIEGPIGPDRVTAKAIREELKAAGNAPVRILMNSPGGSVWEGFSVADEVRRHPGPVEIRITGLAGSIASYIVTAANRVVVTDASTLMIHDPSAITMGDENDHRKSADLLDRLAGQLALAYSRKLGMSVDDTRELMRAESWWHGEAIKTAGFADEYEPDGGERIEREPAAAMIAESFGVAATGAAYWEAVAVIRDTGADLSPEDRQAAKMMGMTIAEYREYAGTFDSLRIDQYGRSHFTPKTQKEQTK
jgi:ATP-dependent protease ClpP protease subunit